MFNILKGNDNNITFIINQGVPAIKKMLKTVSIQKRYAKDKTLLQIKTDIEMIIIDKRSRILNSNIGIQINTKE